ncbi:MAG: isochorismate synthase [Halobacteriales archaeon]|nr:isochorismate synthase [Halobacteriales archaeon]
MDPAPLLAPPASLAAAAEEAVRRARAGGNPVLLGWSQRAQLVEPVAFLLAGDAPRAAFLAPGGDEVVARGEVLTLTAQGATRVDGIRVQAEALAARAVVAGGGPAPRFLGGFAFDPAHEPREPWEGFPSARFTLPAVSLVRRRNESWVTTNALLAGRERPEDVARHLAQVATRAAQPTTGPRLRAGVPLPAFGARVLGKEAWDAGVASALRSIRSGALRKVVLARRVPVPLTAPLRGPDALARVLPGNEATHRFLFEAGADQVLVGASPELLASLHGDEAGSAALAGTAARGATPAEDARLAEELAASAKERREHDIVVQHVRSALRGLGEVRAPSEPEVLRLRSVQHLLTPFALRPASPLHVLDLVAALHPTPAVAGTPTEAALTFLRAHESFARGWYAGPVGWFDLQGDGCFAVALRCAHLREQEAWLYAGAGIVEGADADLEWEETVLKLQPMLEVLASR